MSRLTNHLMDVRGLSHGLNRVHGYCPHDRLNRLDALLQQSA